MGSTNLGDQWRIQVLYWMHRARRDLVLQTPFSTMRTTGTFALRSPIFFKLKIFTGVSFTAVAEISS